MQTEGKHRSSVSSKLEKVSTILWVTGWVGFWIQIGLAAASGLMLVFAISGRNFTQATRPISRLPFPGVRLDTVRQAVTPGIGVGIFWAVCGVLVLLFSIYLAFRQTRYAKRLHDPQSSGGQKRQLHYQWDSLPGTGRNARPAYPGHPHPQAICAGLLFAQSAFRKRF